MDAQQVVITAGTHLPDISVIRYFTQGGFFMWPILAVSFAAMAIGLERYMALKFRFSLDGKRFFNDVKRYITSNDWKRAIELCRQHPSSPLAQVIGAGLAQADRNEDEMETAMESQALYYLPKINARLDYLAVLGNVATLLGLLGTVAGLIASFAVVGTDQFNTSREQALAGGIAVAMYCTAFGLIVAIPAVLSHMYLSGMANSISDDIEHYATSLKQLVQRIKSKTTIPNLDQELSMDSKTEKSNSFSKLPEGQQA